MPGDPGGARGGAAPGVAVQPLAVVWSGVPQPLFPAAGGVEGSCRGAAGPRLELGLRRLCVVEPLGK